VDWAAWLRSSKVCLSRNDNHVEMQLLLPSKAALSVSFCGGQLKNKKKTKNINYLWNLLLNNTCHAFHWVHDVFKRIPYNRVALYLPELLLLLLEAHLYKITKLIFNQKSITHKGQTCVEHELLPFPFEITDVVSK